MATIDDMIATADDVLRSLMPSDGIPFDLSRWALGAAAALGQIRAGLLSLRGETRSRPAPLPPTAWDQAGTRSGYLDKIRSSLKEAGPQGFNTSKLRRLAFSGRGGSSGEFRAALEFMKDAGELVSWKVSTDGRTATYWALSRIDANGQ